MLPHSSVFCPSVRLNVGCFFIFALAFISPVTHISVKFSFWCSPSFLICYAFQISTAFFPKCVYSFHKQRGSYGLQSHFLIVKNNHQKIPSFEEMFTKSKTEELEGHLIVLSCHADEYCLILSLYNFACICLPKFLYWDFNLSDAVDVFLLYFSTFSPKYKAPRSLWFWSMTVTIAACYSNRKTMDALWKLIFSAIKTWDTGCIGYCYIMLL